MRILLVGRHHEAQIRGATVVTHGLARALSARGHDVTLLQSARPEHRVALEGVAMRYRPALRKSVYPLLFALERATHFDLVHAQDESGAYFALRARSGGLPLVAHLHPPVVHREGFWRANWRWRYIGLAARFATRVVTPSRWLAAELAARYRRDPACFAPIPNAIGEHWFEPRAARESSARVVLVNMKGVDVALRAFAKVAAESGATLELYGTHDDQQQYIQLAAELGLAGCTRFCGFVPNAELPARLAGAALLLHPTRSESFGQVLAEAAALGIPALASRVGGVPEVVEDGVTGVLCAAGDVDAFALGLRLLLADDARRRALGAAARERARASWRWSEIASRFEREIYAPLISRTARPR